MIHPHFRTKGAQQRGALTTRSFVPMLNAFTDRARSRPKGTGTKVGTARRAQFAATRLERTAAGEESNRAPVISLEGVRADRFCNADSDKTALFGRFDCKRLIDAVRTPPNSPTPIHVRHSLQGASRKCRIGSLVSNSESLRREYRAVFSAVRATADEQRRSREPSSRRSSIVVITRTPALPKRTTTQPTWSNARVHHR
jgi:hypothetical protein